MRLHPRHSSWSDFLTQRHQPHAARRCGQISLATTRCHNSWPHITVHRTMPQPVAVLPWRGLEIRPPAVAGDHELPSGHPDLVRMASRLGHDLTNLAGACQECLFRNSIAAVPWSHKSSVCLPSKKSSEAWRVCTRDVSLQETPNPLPSDGLQQKCYPVSDGLPKPKKLYRTLT